MKIALISPHGSPYTEKRLVGVKRIIYYLYRGLRKKNHDVKIIAPEDSELDENNLIKTIPSLKKLGISVYDARLFAYCFINGSLAAEAASQFDVIHSHIEYSLLPFIHFIKTPVVSTIHGTEFNNDEKFVFKQFYNQSYTVGISKNSIRFTPYIKYHNQIYNGVDISLYPPNFNTNQKYMFYMGRITPKKGVFEAIKIANLVKKKLIIVGFGELKRENYLEEIDRQSKKSSFIDLREPIFDNDKKIVLYNNARLFLFPVQYEETFASTVIESMSCGTPVVTFAKGSLPEQVVDGQTGLLVNPSDDDIRGDWIIKKTGFEGLCEAVQRIYNMPEEQYKQMRRACRTHVEKNFTVERMVDEYEKVYQEIIEKNNSLTK